MYISYTDFVYGFPLDLQTGLLTFVHCVPLLMFKVVEIPCSNLAGCHMNSNIVSAVAACLESW